MFSRAGSVEAERSSVIAAIAGLSLALSGLLFMPACLFPPGSVLDSIQVRPDFTSIAPAEHQQFTATAIWADGSKQDGHQAGDVELIQRGRGYD